MKQKISEEELRRRAMELYDRNWEVSEICAALGCSRSWFYKWLDRHKNQDEVWFQSQHSIE
ncbi:helix-turn-helix domain-containing protein, partial [Dehalococcoidia bacterium]|nr:helix-turn-helix domain-containing protein [Dehalococcoidia bacterium]